MIKIKIHSFVDLITNSSTTIYVYQQESIPVLKELINEILALCNESYKCDDIFHISNHYEIDQYVESFDNEIADAVFMEKHGLSEEHFSIESMKKLFDSIEHGLEKPKWIKELEKLIKNSDNYHGYEPSNYIYIRTKNPKYNKIASLLKKYLHSPQYEGTYGG
jgi:hypothetical protein